MNAPVALPTHVETVVRPGSFSKASAISVTLGILVILGGFLWSQANHTTVRPAPSVASGGTHSGSTPSSAPAGQDIGLAARWCDLGTLGGLNLLGNGTNSTAWTGYPVNNEGKCLGNNPKWRVAVDVTGDGRADAESGPIKWCSDRDAHRLAHPTWTRTATRSW